MTSRTLASLPRTAAALAALLAAGPAAADRPIRYSPERGGSCTVMIPYYGPRALWIGRLAAERPLDVSSDRIFADARTAESCFFTEAECRTWLARLMIDWRPRPGFALCEPAGGAVMRGGTGPVKP
ncbi:hypothetical protein [Alsobacter sp. SYSU BS001988]|jgi:hypothetical protein